jgi:hypothetical protein
LQPYIETCGNGNDGQPGQHANDDPYQHYDPDNQAAMQGTTSNTLVTQRLLL